MAIQSYLALLFTGSPRVLHTLAMTKQENAHKKSPPGGFYSFFFAHGLVKFASNSRASSDNFLRLELCLLRQA